MDFEAFEKLQAAAQRCQPIDDISNPLYYRSGGMEAIDVIEAFNLGYTLGNAVKYIVRAGKKGSAIDDLRKARWYIDREIGRLSQRG